jgi:hypothetical protein
LFVNAGLCVNVLWSCSNILHIMYVPNPCMKEYYYIHEINQHMHITKICLSYMMGGGPKNNRNLNVARKLEVVTWCTARCYESTQYSSSLPCAVNLGCLLSLLWLFSKCLLGSSAIFLWWLIIKTKECAWSFVFC